MNNHLKEGPTKSSVCLPACLPVCLSVYLSACLCVRRSVRHFSQEFVISFFLIICMIVDIGIFKNWQPFFPGNFIFCQICAKRAQNGPKVFFFTFWKIFPLVFSGNNLKWKLILLLIFYHQSRICQDSGSRVMGRNDVGQSNCRVLWNVISQERSGRWSFFGMQISIEVFYKLILSFWVCVIRHDQNNQISLHIFQYLQKNVKDEVDFLPAD